MIILRVHDSEHSVPRVFRIEHGPCTIGRAPYHSIILSDPRVSQDHAQILQRDGIWMLEDQMSANGILVGGIREKSVTLIEDMEVMIGPIRIEIYVKPEETEHTLEIDMKFRGEPVATRSQFRLHLFSLVSLFSLSLLAYLFRSIRHEFTSEVVVPFLVLIGAAYGASGLVALFSKVHSKRYQFTQFLPLAVILFCSIGMFSIIDDLFYFNAGNRHVALVIEILWKYSTITVVFVFVFRKLLDRVNPRVIWKWVGAIVTLTYLLLGTIQTFISKESDGYDNYGSVSVPIIPMKLRGEPIESWSKRMEEARGIIEKSRAKALEDGDYGGDESESDEDEPETSGDARGEVK